MSVRILAACRAMLGPRAELSPTAVDIVLRNRRIGEIRPAATLPADPTVPAPPDPGVLDARGLLAAPGLINGHFHSGEHFHKGRLENLPVELLMCHVRPPFPLRLGPKELYLRTLVGAIEAVRSGTTTVVDDLNQDLGPRERAAVLRAYEEIGLRAYVGSAMADVPFLASVPYYEEEVPAELRADFDANPVDAERLLGRCRAFGSHDHPRKKRVGYVVAPSAPQRCTEAFLRSAKAISDELDLPLVIHVQETRLQVVHGQQLYGTTMVGYLDRIGLLGPRTTLIHAVWLTREDIERIARAGASVQHNPWSNLRLGSGVAPVRDLLDAGINVSLGSDGCGSTDTLNMLSVLGTAAGIGKLRGERVTRWLTAAEVWHAGTMGGARALGRGDELGALAPGYLADIVLYRLNGIPFVPLGDPVRQLVYAERGSSVDTVLIDGRVVMQKGTLTGIDEAAAIDAIARTVAALRPDLDAATDAARKLEPAYERLRQRALALPMPATILPALLPETAPDVEHDGAESIS